MVYGKLGYHRVFHLILWVLYTGMAWQGLPIPPDAHGKLAIHDRTCTEPWRNRLGSLQQAFMASMAYRSAEKKLDRRMLHGDGTHAIAKKGNGIGSFGSKHQKGEKIIAITGNNGYL
jgi:hypothetical protein